MAALTLEEILRSVPDLDEAERLRLRAALAEPGAGRTKGSAKILLGTLEPASPVDPQERVRRLRDEWGA